MERSDDFRQGTIGRLQTVFIRQDGSIERQPIAFPTVAVIYIDPDNLQPTTAVPVTVMDEEGESGRYYYDWYIPEDEPITEHEIIFRGWLEGEYVIGEDTVTILPKSAVCVFSPTQISGTICKPCCSPCAKYPCQGEG